jgi:hypothetical protein
MISAKYEEVKAFGQSTAAVTSHFEHAEKLELVVDQMRESSRGPAEAGLVNLFTVRSMDNPMDNLWTDKLPTTGYPQ